MRNRMAMLGAACLAVGLLATQASGQQDKSKRPSPPASAQCDLGGGQSVTVDYSSPRAKGRKIFGALEPYDKPWRAGANEATTFVTTVDVKVGSKDVPAGKYTIFAIPNPDKWTFIVSKKTGEWGIPYPGAGFDLLRADMKVSATTAPVENFTIAFDKNGAGCTMRLEWENTSASIEVAKK